MPPQQSLPKIWEEITHHLNQGLTFLPTHPVDNPEGGEVKYFYEFLNANELELALNELEGLGEANKAPAEFWQELLAAADLMKLAEAKKRYAKKLEN